MAGTGRNFGEQGRERYDCRGGQSMVDRISLRSAGCLAVLLSLSQYENPLCQDSCRLSLNSSMIGGSWEAYVFQIFQSSYGSQGC